jgi:hypothetical protein
MTRRKSSQARSVQGSVPYDGCRLSFARERAAQASGQMPAVFSLAKYGKGFGGGWSKPRKFHTRS